MRRINYAEWRSGILCDDGDLTLERLVSFLEWHDEWEQELRYEKKTKWRLFDSDKSVAEIRLHPKLGNGDAFVQIVAEETPRGTILSVETIGSTEWYYIEDAVAKKFGRKRMLRMAGTEVQMDSNEGRFIADLSKLLKPLARLVGEENISSSTAARSIAGEKGIWGNRGGTYRLEADGCNVVVFIDSLTVGPMSNARGENQCDVIDGTKITGPLIERSAPSCPILGVMVGMKPNLTRARWPESWCDPAFNEDEGQKVIGLGKNIFKSYEAMFQSFSGQC